MGSTNKEISLSSLKIHIENPRFEKVLNQREAIKIMIEDQDKKLVALAKDIVGNGLHPGEPVYVVRNPESSRKFDVLEGNRRVTALKLLENPDLIPTHKKKIFKAFQKLHDGYIDDPIKRVNCLLFDTEEESHRWIELKHTGNNKGVGVESWDTSQQDRFTERTKGKTSIALQVLRFMNDSIHVPDDIKAQLKEVSSTSLKRLVGDPIWRDAVGLDYKNGTIVTSYDPKEVAKPLIKTIKDLLSDNFNVTDIYYKKDREKYVATYREEDLPDKSQKLAGPWILNSADPPKVVPSDTKPKNTTPGKKGTKTGTSKKKPRRAIIPEGSSLKVEHKRLEEIYGELQSLDAVDYTNAAAVLYRVLVELSVQNYLNEHPGIVANIRGKPTLRNKLVAITDDFKARKIMTKDELKAIFVSINDKDSIMSVDTFNAYVHNPFFLPETQVLFKTWDNLEHFYAKLWELT